MQSKQPSKNKINFIAVLLIFIVVLVSGIQQSESAVYMHIYPLFLRFFSPYRNHKVLNIFSHAVQEARIYSGEKITSLVSCAWKIGQLDVKE